MTLATHAVVGSLVGALAAESPALAVVGGFASHFLLDAIPHWDYHLSSSRRDNADHMNNDIVVGDRRFLIDLLKIAVDIILGFSIVIILFGNTPFFLGAILGALGGIAPDALQFVYMKWRHQPLILLQRFHIFMHASTSLGDAPVPGVFFQIALITVVVVFAKFLI